MRQAVADVLAGLGAGPVLPQNVSVPSLGGTSAGGGPAAAPGEPIYPPGARADVQGNIIPGFNKDYQHFLFLRIAEIDATKGWLRALAPGLASMEEVLAFVRVHRSQRLRTGMAEPALNATWINIAFSHPGIEKLAGAAQADAFGEPSFRQGLAARSTYVGDPADPAHPGHRSHWLVGGPENAADILVMVAADVSGDLDAAVARVKAAAAGVDIIFEQRGETLPDALRGHEHFGFKDGISQPGVRGRVSSAPGDYITPRYLDPGDPHARLFGKPGQSLVWPGQFLLGEMRQDPEDPYMPAAGASDFPVWARRGSYLVCRRLRQDVVAFWDFAVASAGTLGMAPQQFAAMLVGRWPSGAPIMRAPNADDPALGGDQFANNHFGFEDDAQPSVLAPLPGYPGDSFPQAAADFAGAVCPHFAHIRKLNPRDSATDLGTPADSLLRSLLRRGIPFGPALAGVAAPTPELVAQERGLMFIAFAGTIEDQFEFISRRWANSPLHPASGGHDPILGQRDHAGDRARFIDFPTPNGPRTIALQSEWIIPTGGGYFFAPPISAVTSVLAALAPPPAPSPPRLLARGPGLLA